MTDLNRRQFAKLIFGAPAILAAGRRVFAGTDAGFRFLVVGDSLVWGQGLEEKDKFYTLTRNWLATEAFGAPFDVDLKVKAHSGATLTLHKNEEDALSRAGKRETDKYDPEINVGFPSILRQLQVARDEYTAAGIALSDVRLIMLSGGITDISVASILNPFGDNRQLESDIERYCLKDMSIVLSRASELFPNAITAVIGYYPMISPKTSAHELFNFTLEAYGFPRPLKPIANNALTRQFFKVIKKRSLKRSRIWIEGSERNLRGAIERLNKETGSTRAVYVKAPINESNTFGTGNGLLFEMVKKGRINDHFYDERKERCGPVLNDLKNTTGLRYPIRFCDMAAVGHPASEGSRAFMESIKAALEPHLATLANQTNR